jgi:SAM-dependent methyltransferase
VHLAVSQLCRLGRFEALGVKRTLVLAARAGRQRWLRSEALPAIRAGGRVRFGSLRRLEPVSRSFGFDRGTPVDRYYIERFLAAHAGDIRGRVLEFGDARYTQMLGGERVTRSDVLDVVASNPHATIVADLTCADNVASNSFDCIVCTQTLQMIYDIRAAVSELRRILAPGGTLLLTGHGTSKTGRHLDSDPWGEYWRITGDSARLMLQEVFTAESVLVETFGNVLSAICSLEGLAAEELRPDELDYRDRDFEVVVAARAVK